MDFQESVKQIRDILANVKYPGSPKSVVQLDMVKNIKVDESGVTLVLVFPKKGDPFEKSIVNKCNAALGEAGYSAQISVVYAQDMERPDLPMPQPNWPTLLTYQHHPYQMKLQ